MTFKKIVSVCYIFKKKSKFKNNHFKWEVANSKFSKLIEYFRGEKMC
jgi:hypothetical protein